MSDTLRVLLVDDNPQDRGLIIRELRKSHANVDVTQVIDQAQFDRAIQAAEFSIVITDYQLMWSTGVKILNAVKGRWPDRPVIMFTATGNEEVAVEAMKSGLDDYIIKSVPHLIRLNAAVDAAVKNSRTRRRARDLEIRLQSLLARLNVGVFRCNERGQFLEANSACLTLLQLKSVGEARSIGLTWLYRSSDQLRQFLDTVSRTAIPQEQEIEWRHPENGCERIFRLSLVPAEPANGTPLFDGLLEDITQRKRNEADERDRAVASARLSQLSPREREVLKCVVVGKPNKVTARELDISEKTVEKHRANMMKKLQLTASAELIGLAFQARQVVDPVVSP